MSIQTTNDLTYKFPAKPRLQFKNLDGDLLYTWDGFADPDDNPFAVVSADVENAIRETGVYQIVIYDKENVIEPSTLHDCKVLWEIGKSQAGLEYFLTGFTDFIDYDNPIDNYHQYILSGYGSWIQASELFLTKRKSSTIQDVANAKVVPDPDYDIPELLQDSLDGASWRPREIDREISYWTGWSNAGIDRSIKLNKPVVNIFLKRFKDWVDELSDESGASIFLDMSQGEPEILTCVFSPNLHTGVTIKDGSTFNDVDRFIDDATKTSYYKVPFRLSFDSSSGAGVANVLYSTNIQDSVSVASSFTNGGSTTVNNQALAQQIQITADTKHIDGFAGMFRKIGNPESPKDRVNFDIVADNNDTPTGKVLETFEIPLSSIKSEVDTIFVTDLDLKEKSIIGGTPKIWIRAFQRSGITGNPINDPANTIAWHHNGIFNTAQPLKSASAPGGDRELKDSLAWTVSSNGPIYTFGLFSDIRRLLSRLNPQSLRRIRRKEEFIDSSNFNDPISINRLLALQLSLTSKSRVQAPEFMTSIPNNFIFRPYQEVTLVTPKFTGDLRVQRVRYSFGAIKGESAVGAIHAFITLGGSYNPLIANASCV